MQQKEEKGDPGEQLTLQNKALQACQTKKDKLLELASSAAIATRSLTEQHDETEQKKMLTKVSPMQEKYVRFVVISGILNLCKLVIVIIQGLTDVNEAVCVCNDSIKH